MDFTPLSREQWEFVGRHANANIPALRLRYHGRKEDIAAAITQIECRQKAGSKLAATLSALPRFTFPGVLAAEQCTSDGLADFHASLVAPGARVADLTCGLGIDAMYMAGRAASVTAIERSPDVAAAAAYNASQAGLNNLHVVNGDCRKWLDTECDGAFDVMFIDPARRDAAGGRVHLLADCEPDVTTLLPLIGLHSPRLIIKASPMLDITATITELTRAGGTVSAIYATGTATECKELVIDMLTHSVEEPDEPVIHAVTPGVYSPACFTRSREASLQAAVAPESALRPGAILLEPAPAVMKCGCFRSLAADFGVDMLSGATHLYVTDKDIDGWPGRRMTVTGVWKFSSSALKALAARKLEANVSVRGFPLTAPKLALKLGIRSCGSGKSWVIGATTAGDPVIITAELLFS